MTLKDKKNIFSAENSIKKVYDRNDDDDDDDDKDDGLLC